MKLKTHYVAILATALLSTAYGDSIIFDRGLPTANLNNAAGANRANVAWADAETSATPNDPYYVGDNFSLSGSGSYTVSDIRMWVVGGNTTGLSLMGGPNASSISTLSSTYTVTPATYSGGATYQGSGGGDIPISAVDFAVNLQLMAGTLFNVFLGNTIWTPDGNIFVGPFVHASNAGLSGSTQEGADNLYSFYEPSTGTIYPEDSATDGTWDKSSDLNIQVIGHKDTTRSAPDTASTAVMAMASIGGLFIARRKMVMA